MGLRDLKKKKESYAFLSGVDVSGKNIVISVSDNKAIKKGQEVFIVAPSKQKTQFNIIKKTKDVIVRAKVVTIDGNSLTLSSVPENISVVAAEPSIKKCINDSIPVYIKGIESW